MSVVPDLGRYLMTAQNVLERLLVLGPALQQPVGPRISNAIAENQIESKRNFVDEVVHVGLEAAIVVAAEHQSTLIVDEHPPRKMYRANACQPAVIVDMSCGVVDDPKQEAQEPKAKAAWFQCAHRGELICNLMIFNIRQSIRMC